MLIGILGGGQLGRMLALAGYELGLRFRFLDPSPEAPAGHVGELMIGGYDNPDTLARFAQGCDCITYEFENVPVRAAQILAQSAPVFPPVAALDTGQDRISEKTLFASLGLGVPRCRPVDSLDDLKDAIAFTGFPAILKTRRLGYDGKGQFLIRSLGDLDRAWAELGPHPVIALAPPGSRPPEIPAGLILEAFVPFERELSILSVRSRSGEMRFYPLVQNAHASGILRRSVAPAPATDSAAMDVLQASAERAARKIAEHLNYVGVLALELFQIGDRLIVNEMAPRVHNSGHWTIEGSRTSQFENHIRAVAGLPLGDTAMAALQAVMLNLIGHIPDPARVLAVPGAGAHLHLYGKSSRPGRKVGHITITGDEGQVAAAEQALAPLIHPPEPRT